MSGEKTDEKRPPEGGAKSEMDQDPVKLLIRLRGRLIKAIGEIDAYLGSKAQPEADLGKYGQLFPEELRGLLRITEEGDQIIIKPLCFLGRELFRKAAAIVEEHGGAYVSDGEESHFVIRKGA
jgi:hypothetical protein